MHCTFKTQVSPEKKSQLQRWHNQNLFLQDRHGDDQSTFQETILVGLRSNKDDFDLLSWTINMAARPGDSVIALHLGDPGKVEDCRLQKEKQPEPQVSNNQFKPLRELCNIKQVQLEVKFAATGSAEKVLIEQASALKATMLVVSTFSRHVLRHSHKRGSFLARHAPAGCSVVVVKNYKVLFYRDNGMKATTDRSITIFEDAQHALPKDLVVHDFGSLQQQLSCKSTPARDMGTDSDLCTNNTTGSKGLLDHVGDDSPRGVLEGLGASSESDGSSPSSSYSGLSQSLSRKALLSSASSYKEGSTAWGTQHGNCLSLGRNKSVQRSATFPSSNRLQRFSASFHCNSMRSSLKSYINSLWGTEGMYHGSTCIPSTLMNDKQSWRCFTYEELALATDNFNPDNMVGKGGHAEVYKGSLLDGRLVAVKRLTRGDTEELNERDFLTELGIIGHVSHPNATPLLGFCIEKGLHLIFHFSSNGSLASHLYGSNTSVLEWSLRYKIALGTARGLHYLHTGCQRRIIHRDIKASNILLDPDFEPQISDFGLAKWLPEQWTHRTVTPIEGTFGYLAPEYFMHGIVDEKTDVFAFGVLLLELITGRRPIENSQQSLVIWARPLLESSNIEELADPRLSGAFSSQEMQCMVMAAGVCVQQSAACRPCMSQVLQLLANEGPTSDTEKSWSMPLSSQSIYFEDSSFDEEYSCINYLSDLNRHREIALQF